jgi:hypothetical protein
VQRPTPATDAPRPPRRTPVGLADDALPALVACWCMVAFVNLAQLAVANLGHPADHGPAEIGGAVAVTLFFSTVLFLFGFPLLLICMLPVLLLSRWPACRGWICHAAVGTCTGALLAVLVRAASIGNGRASATDPALDLAAFVGTGALAGIVGGAIFWLIRRPDRLPAPPAA